MPFDSTSPRPTAWTTYDELTPDQRERYGDYVRSRDEVRLRCEANREGRERAEDALRDAGGDKLKALALALAAQAKVA